MFRPRAPPARGEPRHAVPATGRGTPLIRMIVASTAPTLTVVPNISSSISTICRREPIARHDGDVASNRGPNADADTPSPSASTAVPHSSTAAGATWLDHQCHDLRQLPLLTENRDPNPLLTAVKSTPAPATDRNMVNVIIDPLRCGEFPGLALMPRLPAALLTTLPLGSLALSARDAADGSTADRSTAPTNCPRITLQQPIVLIHPLPQRGDLRQQPQHQLNRRLTTRPSDPLRIRNTHERKIPCALKESSRSPRPT